LTGIALPAAVSVSVRWFAGVKLASTVVHVVSSTEKESVAIFVCVALGLTEIIVLVSPSSELVAS
jgi:hypothetical protein